MYLLLLVFISLAKYMKATTDNYIKVAAETNLNETKIMLKFFSELLHFRIIVQRTKNGNLEIFDHPARIALDMATTREGKKRSATEMVYICSSSWLLNHVIYPKVRIRK